MMRSVQYLRNEENSVEFEVLFIVSMEVDGKSLVRFKGYTGVNSCEVMSDLLSAFHLRSHGQYKEALAALERAANNGDVSRCMLYEIGMAYRSGGWGLESDNGMALPWFRKCVAKAR
jgi:hypothetical protein